MRTEEARRWSGDKGWSDKSSRGVAREGARARNHRCREPSPPSGSPRSPSSLSGCTPREASTPRVVHAATQHRLHHGEHLAPHVPVTRSRRSLAHRAPRTLAVRRASGPRYPILARRPRGPARRRPGRHGGPGGAGQSAGPHRSPRRDRDPATPGWTRRHARRAGHAGDPERWPEGADDGAGAGGADPCRTQAISR